MGDVVNFIRPAPKPAVDPLLRAAMTNGCRDALVRLYGDPEIRALIEAQRTLEEGVDVMLAALWLAGYKVVPIDRPPDIAS